MTEKPKLSVIIPVYNEKGTVERAIQRIADLDVSKEIIVVDDHSTDGSSEVIEKIKGKYDFTLITNSENHGKGFSVIKASNSAKGEFIIVEDSDLELNPQNIPGMLKVLETEGLDLVNGDRNVVSLKNSNMISKIAKVVTKFLLRLLYGHKINDLLSSYKLCKLEKFKSLGLKSERFGFETEWLITALKRQWKIKEVYIDYYPRKMSEGKKITPKDGLEIIFNIIKYRFRP